MSEYYGSIMKWFVGEVVEILSDHTGLFRVKVRADGIHSDNIATGDLPLATVAGDTQGGANGIGVNHSLVPTARVWGFFLDGEDCQLPMVCGAIPHIARAPENNTKVTSPEDVLEMIATDIRSIVTEHDNMINQITNAGNSSSNDKIAWDFFKSKGKYTLKQAAGIIGNLDHESGLDPKKNQNGGGPGRGIAQWERSKGGSGRWDIFLDFAAKKSADPYELLTQLEFVHWELHNVPYHTRNFFEAKTLDEATMFFCRYYEAPADFKTTDNLPYPNPTIKSPNVNHKSTWKYNKGSPWRIKNGEEDRLTKARAAYRDNSQG